MLSSLDLRFRAIMALQAIRSRHSPGSDRYEHAERAIDLVLSKDRTIDDFLVRNVLRDAERVRVRQLQSRQMISASDADSDEQLGLVDSTSPYDFAVAKDMLRRLSSNARQLGSNGLRILDGMLLSETLTETAAAVGLTESRVNQLRRQIRSNAKLLWAIENSSSHRV